MLRCRLTVVYPSQTRVWYFDAVSIADAETQAWALVNRYTGEEAIDLSYL